LKNGADITAANVLGDTSLHHACSCCSEEVCLMLLDKGAQLDKVSFFGYGSTALALATRSHRIDLVQAFIQRGADATILDGLGRSSLD
jgi:ankyrin repeat protein